MTAPSIEEALAALDNLRRSGWASDSVIVRAFIESAAQEQKAWREIGAWTTEHKNRTSELLHTPDADEGQEFAVRLSGRLLNEVFEADSRLAAIVAAGEYCRAEMEKR